MNTVVSAPAGLDGSRVDATNLRRSANALVLGVALTTGLGFFYWVIAARLYDADDIGKVSALIGAMTFLATVATLGLTNGLVRFLPATSTPGRLIRNAYLVAGLVGALAAAVFVAGQPWWGAGLGFVRVNALTVAFFMAATAVWVLFMLKDSVMTGLLHARLVPVQNGTYAVVKLVLLVLLVPFAAWGVFVSWTVPALVVLLPVNWYVSHRILPGRRVSASARSLPLREVAEFAVPDYVASLLWMGTTQLMPLIVLSKISADAGATYFVSFSIAYALFLVTTSVGSAYLAEAASHPDQASALLRRAARQASMLVVPASLVGIVVAPLALRLYGPAYVDNGSWLLRLLIASAIPQVVIGLTLADARHRGNTRLVMTVYAVIAAAVLGGSLLTIGRFGVVAAGWTWFVTQIVVAALLLGRHRDDLSNLALELASDVRRQLRILRNRQRMHAVRPAVDQLLADEPGQGGAHELLASDNSTLVIGAEQFVAKVAVDELGARGLIANASTLRALDDDPRVAHLWPLLPRMVGERAGPDGHVAVETRLDGIGVDRLGRAAREQAVRNFAAHLESLNLATRTTVRCTDRQLRHLVGGPIERLREQPWLRDVDAELELVGRWLTARLRNVRLAVGRTHGDPWVANALARDGGASVTISGIVDWEDSRPDGLLDTDLTLLWLSMSDRQLGDIVPDVLADPDDADHEILAALGVERPNPTVAPATIVVLAWLQHVDGQLARNPRARHHRAWLDRNVAGVATAVAARCEREATGRRAPSRRRRPERPPRPLPTAVRARRWLGDNRLPLASLALAAAVWIVACIPVDVGAMDDYGLVSVLNVGHALALGILVGGFVWSLHNRRGELILALHVVVLVAFWQVTTAVLYDTLRLAWAWKHTGVVEYLMREGKLDTTVDVSPIYHSWPGFFAGAGLLTELVGARSAVTIAIWTPLVLDLLTVAALRALLRNFTDDLRVLWLAVWFFVLANWVGQDYFSPQGVGFVLYLVVLAVALRTERVAPLRRGENVPAALAVGPARAVLALLLVVIASSHQITPLMTVIALGSLWLTRQIRPRFVLTVAVVATAGWALTIGRGVLGQMTNELLDEFGDPIGSTSATFDRSAFLNDAQQVVSLAGRVLVVGLVALALVGLVRQWQRGRLHPAATALLAAPAVLVPITPFGGEVLFRAFLFAAPFLAFAAATAVFPDRVPVEDRRSTLAIGLITAVMIPCFVLASYGKDRQYSFTGDEVAAATWLYQNAPAGSTIIEGSTNYPRQFLRYEQFTYVPIASEPEESRDAVVANPSFLLGRWLADDRPPATYLILTRSQAIDIDSVGPLAAGSIEAIETAVLDSPRFAVVYANDDAVIIQLARPVRS